MSETEETYPTVTMPLSAVSEYVATPTQHAVHISSEDALFSGSTVTVGVVDDASGPFVVLESFNGKGRVELDLEQLEIVLEVARSLIEAHTPKGTD